jgi:hypothetical protein
MTTRVSSIIKDYGQWIYMEDIYDLYHHMIADGLDPDNVCDETLKKLVVKYTEEKTNNERI